MSERTEYLMRKWHGEAMALRKELAEEKARSGRWHMEVVDALLDALGLSDDMTEAEVAARLDGCDCNGEQGTKHLIWHLAQRKADPFGGIRDGADIAPDDKDDCGICEWHTANPNCPVHRDDGTQP